MDTKKLITTALLETKSQEVPVAYLGKWCLDEPLEDGGLDDLDIVPYHWDDRERLASDYVLLSQLYEQALLGITYSLNTLHNVNHEVRYWRILVGPWLGYIIQILYDRWKVIEWATRCSKFLTEVLSIPEDKVVPYDNRVFNSAIQSDYWNHYIFAEIIKNFNQIKTQPYSKQIKTQSHHEFLSNKIDTLNSAVLKLEKVLSFLVDDKDFYFTATYLPLKQLTKLQLSMLQFPMIYSTSQETILYELNPRMRQWSVNFGDKSIINERFEKWLSGFIAKQIPRSYVEAYSTILSNTKKRKLPKAPKVIWTSNLYHDHDHFKLWCAEKVELGSKLIIGQHGGNYGMAKWNFSEDHQVKISDRYFSWGWKDLDRNNVVPIGQLKCLPVVPYDEARSSGMLVTMELPRYSYMMMSATVAGQWLDYMDDQLAFMRALPKSIREKFFVRLKPRKYGWNPDKRWAKEMPEVNLDRGKKPFHKEVAQSRVVVSTYNAATYLESMAMDIPTIMFWNPEHWEMREETQQFMDELKRVGIFHATPESAASHIANVWGNVYSWWHDAEVRNVKNDFCELYSRQSNNMLSDIKRAILQMNP